MKKLNKKFVFAFALIAVIGLTACGSKDSNQDNNADTTPNVETPTQDKEEKEDITQPSKEGEEEQKILDEIHTAVADAYGESYVANQPFDTATIQEKFGLSNDMYDAIIAQGPMMSAHVDNFIAVHPSEGNHDAVVKALNSYRDTLLEDTLQYPSNLVKIQASRVEEVGDYVFFLMLGFGDDTLEDEEEVLASFKAQNDIAVKAIKEVVEQ